MVLTAFSFAVPVTSRSNLGIAPCALRRSTFMPVAKPALFTSTPDRFVSVRRTSWMSSKGINISPTPPGGDPINISPVPSSNKSTEVDPAMNGSVPSAGTPVTISYAPTAQAAATPGATSTPVTISYVPTQQAAATPGATSTPVTISYIPTEAAAPLGATSTPVTISYIPTQAAAPPGPLTAPVTISYIPTEKAGESPAPTPVTISYTPTVASLPAPIVAAAPSGEVATLSGPPGVFNAAVALGTTKANKSLSAIILMGIAAGAYIAIGCMMSLAITGNSTNFTATNPGLSKFIFGFVGQPWGLFMVLTTGAELFTGNSMLMTTAALRGKTNWPTVIAKWLLVFVANCVGALGVVWFALKSQVVSASAAAYVAALASAKVAVPWEVAFLRGIGCNWIVCVGVLAATGSRDLVGKFMAALAVVSMFVTLGFDQCIANMFFLPLGLLCGGDLTVKSLVLSNIIPVTLGNIVGGALLVGMVYHVVNGGKKKAAAK